MYEGAWVKKAHWGLQPLGRPWEVSQLEEEVTCLPNHFSNALST